MADTAEVILNVDDDPASRYTVTRILRKGGFTVREAGSGEEALQMAAGGPALVVLDVNLPDINGFEVCRRIKSDPATASVAVLHLSARFVRGQDRVVGLEGGADGYLTQPVDAAELLATVRSLLRLRRAEEEARTLARQWQATFDAINDGVCLVDRDGTVLQCNRALEEVLGRPAEAVLRRPFREVFPDPGVPAGEDPVGRLRWSRRREAAEQAVGGHYFRVTADPLLQPDGQVRGAVLIVTDLTESRRAERAEAEAQRQAARVAELEREVRALEALAAQPGAAVTAQLFGAAPLREASPAAFAELVGHYAGLLEMALERREYKVDHSPSEQLRAMGDRLGFLRAGPRDVVSVYSAALKEKSAGAAAPKAHAYVEEGRLMALELMGHLVTYYRLRSPPAAPGGGGAAGEGPRPPAPAGGG
jgi:PAS domain S-box-containing protein